MKSEAIVTLMKLALIVVAAFAIFGLPGCAEHAVDEPQPTKATPGPHFRYPGKVYVTPKVDVVEFRLEDGVRCVAINSGGIACDWRREELEGAP